jgi:hypothetical protein
MAVPLSCGEPAQWPPSAIPVQMLEAAAQDWYEFRDNSCLVKVWIMSPWISAAMVLCTLPIFLFNALSFGTHGEVGQTMGILIGVCAFSLLAAFSCYVHVCLLPQLKNEVSARLAAPLSRALAGFGWTVGVNYAIRGRRTITPQGLDPGCMTPGWIWLDFIPAMQVGAPPPATAYQGYTSEMMPMMAYQGNCLPGPRPPMAPPFGHHFGSASSGRAFLSA